MTPTTPMGLARNIVNQLFDLADVDVSTRQRVNDRADTFVQGLLAERFTGPAYPVIESVEQLADQYNQACDSSTWTGEFIVRAPDGSHVVFQSETGDLYTLATWEPDPNPTRPAAALFADGNVVRLIWDGRLCDD